MLTRSEVDLRGHHYFVLASFVALALGTGSAQAQQPGDTRARVHFDAGRSYFEEGNYERALVEFDAAYALSPRPLMLYNIGATQERLAMLPEAAATFERYLREVPDAANRELVRRRIENLRRRLAAQAEAPADPGAPRASSGDGGLVVGGGVALGAAGAALVVFAVAGGLAWSEDAEVRDGCYAGHECTAADVGSLRDFALVADVAWPIAAGAAVLGGVLLVLGVTASGERAPTARWVPVLTPDTVALVVGGAL